MNDMIPTAAVEAAAQAFERHSGVRDTLAMENVLEAAAPYMLQEAKAEAWEEGRMADDFEVSIGMDWNPYRTTK